MGLSANFETGIRIGDIVLDEIGLGVQWATGTGGAMMLGAEVFGAVDILPALPLSSSDGVLQTPGLVRFVDSHTNEEHGRTSPEAFAAFIGALKLRGSFGVFVTAGDPGQLDMCKTALSKKKKPPLQIRAKISFGMARWYTKAFGFKYLHIGNLGFNLQVKTTPPFFDTFSGQAEMCIGTAGRCAACDFGLKDNRGGRCDRTIRAGVYAGVGAKNQFVYAELLSSLSWAQILEALELDRLLGISIPDGLNFVEIGPRSGQRAAVMSFSKFAQRVPRGYDVLTQRYDDELVVEQGIVVDCRVTLFPRVPWLRFSAELKLIAGGQTFLVDYTQDPISWGCSSDGSGCLFELTGYDHTPENPQGPRFYVHARFLNPLDGTVALSPEKIYAKGLGKKSLEPETGRRRRQQPTAGVGDRTHGDRPQPPVHRAVTTEPGDRNYCQCECEVCDPPPVYTAVPWGGTDAIAATREQHQQACERLCSTNILCEALTWQNRTASPLDSNCEIWAARGSLRRRRQQPAQADNRLAAAPLHLEKLIAALDNLKYVPLHNMSGQHHEGVTLYWIKTDTTTECQRACDRTVLCKGISIYSGDFPLASSLDQGGKNCRLVGEAMEHGPWTPLKAGPWTSRHSDPFAARLSKTKSCSNSSNTDSSDRPRVDRRDTDAHHVRPCASTGGAVIIKPVAGYGGGAQFTVPKAAGMSDETRHQCVLETDVLEKGSRRKEHNRILIGGRPMTLRLLNAPRTVRGDAAGEFQSNRASNPTVLMQLIESYAYTESYVTALANSTEHPTGCEQLDAAKCVEMKRAGCKWLTGLTDGGQCITNSSGNVGALYVTFAQGSAVPRRALELRRYGTLGISNDSVFADPGRPGLPQAWELIEVDDSPGQFVIRVASSGLTWALVAGKYDQTYTNGFRDLNTVSCDGTMVWRNNTLSGKLTPSGSQLPPRRASQNNDPNYSAEDGWHFREWDHDEAWEFVRFLHGQMEVDHFCKDPNLCNGTSPQGSPNFCCSSLSSRQRVSCEGAEQIYPTADPSDLNDLESGNGLGSGVLNINSTAGPSGGAFLYHWGMAWNFYDGKGVIKDAEAARGVGLDVDISYQQALNESDFGYRFEFECVTDLSPCAGLNEGDACNSCRYDPSVTDDVTALWSLSAPREDLKAQQTRCAARRRQPRGRAFEQCVAADAVSGNLQCMPKFDGECLDHCHCSSEEYCGSDQKCHTATITHFSKFDFSSFEQGLFARSHHGSDEVFLGTTMYWADVETKDECLHECASSYACKVRPPSSSMHYAMLLAELLITLAISCIALAALYLLLLVFASLPGVYAY